MVYLSLEFKLSFMTDSPLETKPRDPDKNLRMETAKFQIGLDEAKASFYPFCNPSVCIKNKIEVCLKEF